MPIETSLPFPNPSPNARVGWPDVGANVTTTSAFLISGFGEGYPNTRPNVWGTSTGAGTNTMHFRNGVICGLFDDVVFRGCEVAHHLQEIDANLAPGYVGVEFSRVYRLNIALSIDGAAGKGTGLQFGPTDLQQPKFTQGGQAAFGVVGDGAGGWEYIQSDTGAFPGNVTDEVAIPVGFIPDATDWNTFVFEIINSAPGRDASMSLTINGQFFLSRSWAAAPILPLYSEVANANKMVWGCRANDAGVDLFVGPWMINMGRFTAAGLELLA